MGSPESENKQRNSSFVDEVPSSEDLTTTPVPTTTTTTQVEDSDNIQAEDRAEETPPQDAAGQIKKRDYPQPPTLAAAAAAAGLSENSQARTDWESKRRGGGTSVSHRPSTQSTTSTTSSSSSNIICTTHSPSSSTSTMLRAKHGLNRPPPTSSSSSQQTNYSNNNIMLKDEEKDITVDPSPSPSSSVAVTKPHFYACPSLQRAPAPVAAIMTSIPDHFLPDEMPSSLSRGTTIPTTSHPQEQRPGAYRWSQQTATLERNQSLEYPPPPPLVDLESQQTVQIGGSSSATNLMRNRPPHHQSPSQSGFLIEATLVEDADATATTNRPQMVVIKAEELYCFGFSKKQVLAIAGCLMIVSVIIAVLVTILDQDTTAGGVEGGGQAAPTTMAPTTTTPRLPTLQRIRERGFLKCGIWDESHQMIKMAKVLDREEDQIDIALCRSIAAAVLGNATKYETIDSSQEENFELLANGTIDLLASHVETSMQADVYEDEHDINVGITFSVPYLYSDAVFGGLPEFVHCVDNDRINTKGNCSELRICLNTDSEYIDVLKEVTAESYMVLKGNMTDILGAFLNGQCNIIPAENTGIMELVLRTFLPKNTPQFTKGKRPFTQDAATIATRDDDPEWSDFVNGILIGLFAAEQANITQANASEMARAAVLGEELVHAVAAVGNYGDIFARGLDSIMRRGDWNLINNGSTGLLYTLPFGKVYKVGPGPVPGGTLESVANSRHLNCGVRLDRPGFAICNNDTTSCEGLDVDYCRAVASAVFKGDTERVKIVTIHDEADGYQKMSSGEVDVLAGFSWTIQNDLHEETTGRGYSFSQPYFYKPIEEQSNNTSSMDFDENLCLVTREDDPQFSSFVNWIVSATFYAEYSIEHRYISQTITKENPHDMPDVRLFGDEYLKMLRNAILAVGNYKEMYERNVATILPRGGRNTINSVEQRGPQIYLPPGFFKDT